ncbi:MAG TPA: hypothetical protein VNU97_10225 [Rhizomicrobium sp.]|jgi:hypothetical protein|nr:hypothetical protein [Rhizomicrobium sp.]
MKTILAASAVLLFATTAFAADPVVPPPPQTSPVITMPASAAPGETCARLIARAKGTTLPADAARAATARSEIAAADAANDDATCRLHAKNALDAMGAN